MADWSLAASLLSVSEPAPPGGTEPTPTPTPTPPPPPPPPSPLLLPPPPAGACALDRASAVARTLSARRAALRADDLRAARRRATATTDAGAGPPTARDVADARIAAEVLARHLRRAVRDKNVVVDRLTPTPANEALCVAPHLHNDLAAFVAAVIAMDDKRVRWRQQQQRQQHHTRDKCEEKDREARAQAQRASDAETHKHPHQQSADAAVCEGPLLAAKWLATFQPEESVLDAQIQDAAALLAMAQSAFDKSRNGYSAMKRLYDQECDALDKENSRATPEHKYDTSI